MIFVVDTETTGMDPATDRVVEFAAVPVRIVDSLGDDPAQRTTVIDAGASSLVYPGISIPPEASAVHHLIDEDVESAPPLGRAVNYVLGPMWQADTDKVFVAHQARFDRPFLPMLHDGARWVCTYRCAMHVWPDAPAYGNQVLRYWLKLPVARDLPVHRALSDATVTAHLFARLLQERSLEDLVKLSTKAALLKTVGFGEHFGKPWDQMPTSYLEWMEGKLDKWEPDVRYTLKFELARRRQIAGK